MRITIGNSVIDTSDRFSLPYIIAEVGVNHEGDIEKAKLMIRQAKEAGANAVKFQTYKAGKLASKYSPSYWDTTKEPTKSQYELFSRYDKFGEEEYIELWKYAKEVGIDFMSTPFDFEAVDFLYDLVPAYKVASADITNYPLLRYIAKQGKPILLSTGASTVSEIWKAVEVIREVGNEQIVLLHCVLNYPTKIENANIAMISDMKRIFGDFIIGYSDHTLPDHIEDVLVTAWLLGAQVIEKHFTYDKSLPGNDHYHSMDYRDLKRLIAKLNFMKTILGNERKTFLDTEIPARKNARRSLVAARFIPKGKTIEEDDIAIKRPGVGVPPDLYNVVVGSTATRDIKEDEIIKFGYFAVKD